MGTITAYRLRHSYDSVPEDTIVYDFQGCDYGLASEDSRRLQVPMVSVTLNDNGEWPSFTVPEHMLVHRATHTDVEPSCCAHCGTKQTTASDVTGKQSPYPGAYALCITCGEWNVFSEDLKLRLPTVDEIIAVGRDKDAGRLRDAWASAQILRTKGML